MTDPTHEDIERLLWFVHDECHDFVQANMGNYIFNSLDKREGVNYLGYIEQRR